jgi:hypothetical protein
MARPLPHRARWVSTAFLSLIAVKCCDRCLIPRQSIHPVPAEPERNPALQHPVTLAVATRSHGLAAWHDTCTGCGMKQPRRESVMSSVLLRRKGFTGAGQWEGMVGVREGHHRSGPTGEWSLSSHSPGQEPQVVGLEDLLRLRREAGDAGGLDGELPS